MSTNLPALVPLADMVRMADAVVESKLFGVENKAQALALMLVAQAENMHPMTACQEFHIIKGRPSRKAWAMQARFQAAGGSIEWHERTDTKASATFSHPQGGTIKVDWDLARAAKADVTGNPMWKKYPRNMLSARVISEGCRAVFPGATGGFYTPEEQQDMPAPPRDVTPPKPQRADFHTPITMAGTNPPAPIYDVESGETVETKPATVIPTHWPAATDDRKVWIAAAQLAIRDVEALTTEDDVLAWQEANTEGLQALMKGHNEVYQRLGAKLAEHVAKLTPALA